MKLKIKSKRIILTSIFIALALFLFILVLPISYAKSSGHQKFENVDKSKTFFKSKRLLSPELNIFQKYETGEVKANYVKLKRDKLILWKVDSVTTQSTKVRDDLSTEEKKKLSDENLEKLAQGIKDGVVSENQPLTGAEDFIDLNSEQLGEISRSVEETQNEYKEGTLIREISSPDGQYKASTFIGGDVHENYTMIDGKKVNELKNSITLAFEPTNEYLYFVKYLESPGGIPHGEVEIVKTIFRYSLKEEKAEEFFNATPHSILSLSANSKSILYSSEGNEVVLLDMNTKEKRNIDISHLTKTQGYVPMPVTSIESLSEESGVIRITKVLEGGEVRHEIFNLNLDNFELTAV